MAGESQSVEPAEVVVQRMFPLVSSTADRPPLPTIKTLPP